MSAPANCQNCGYSSRYSRQKANEQPLYVKAANAWVCAGCRKLRGWKATEPDAEALARLELWLAVPPNDGWYGRIPDLVYHSDRASLSSSGARTLMQGGGPAKFKAAQDEPPNPKPEYDFGHAAHKMVLGEGSQLVKVDAENWRTNDAKAKRVKAWAEGKAPLLKSAIDVAQVMAGKVHSHPLAAKLLQAGTPEFSGYWHDDATGVRLRFRPDWITDPRSGRMICVDYKSAKTADPAQFRRSIADYGYHCQAAWYLDGLREVEISDDAAFVFIVQEKTFPFLVSVVQLDLEAIEIGRQKNRLAINRYAECRESNEWPGYDNTIHTLSLPSWVVKQHNEEGAAAHA